MLIKNIVSIDNMISLIKKAHISAKINFIPRLVAGYGYIFIGWNILGHNIFDPPILFLLIMAFIWAFLSFLLAAIKGTKKQEILNMKLDALFLGFVFITLPNYLIMFSTSIILISNSLYIGYFKLLKEILIIYFTLILSTFFVFNIEIIHISIMNEMMVMVHLTIYFSIISIMMAGLIKDFIVLSKKQKDLAIKDPLTGSYNRAYLDKELSREVNRCVRMQYPIAIIFSDIDYFKKINDKYGHGAGDEILKSFVTILNGAIRKEFDWVARFGGEEFIIVLANTSIDDGALIAEKMRESVANHKFFINRKCINITSSFGVSGIDEFNTTLDAKILLERADQALYRAKENGRDCVMQQKAIIEKTKGHMS